MAEIFDFTTQPVSSNERWPENTLRISGINDSGRDLESILARDNIDTRGGLSLSGGPTTFSLAGTRSLASVTLFTGLRFAAFVNTTCAANPTLNISGSGARTISLSSGVAARAGDMIQGMVAEFVFDAANNTWILLNPSSIHPSASSVAISGDQPIFEASSTRDTDFTSMVLLRAIGRNSAAEDIEYNRLDFQAADVSDGTEDGRFVVRQMQAGTLTAGFDLRDANRLALFGENPDSDDNTIAVPAGFKFVEDGVDRPLGTLLRVTRVASGSHAFLSTATYAVIEACGAGGGGASSPSSYGNVPNGGGTGGNTSIAGTGIAITAVGGIGGNASGRDGQNLNSASNSATGASVVSSYFERHKGGAGGPGAYAGTTGNPGDRMVAFCDTLPASVTVTPGTGGTGATGPQGNGRAGEAGYALVREYR